MSEKSDGKTACSYQRLHEDLIRLTETWKARGETPNGAMHALIVHLGEYIEAVPDEKFARSRAFWLAVYDLGIVTGVPTPFIKVAEDEDNQAVH